MCGSSYHTSWIPILSLLQLVPMHMLQWLAICDAVACDADALLKLKRPPSLSLFAFIKRLSLRYPA